MTVTDVADRVESAWQRYKASIAIVGVVAVAVLTIVLFRIEADHRQSAITRSACESITQVKRAAQDLSQPTSEAGVTDPATLERIRVSNAARASARQRLDKALACHR